MSNRITHVYIQGGRKLTLRFLDGYEGNLDFSEMEFEGIAAPLADESYFQRMRVEGSSIAWPNEYDICPDVLRLWCERGRVLPDAETHAALAHP